MYHYKYTYTYLSLIIFVLLFFQLSWVRRNDWHILSHGTRMFTKDDRFQVKIFCLFLLTQALSSQIDVFERKYFTIEITISFNPMITEGNSGHFKVIPKVSQGHTKLTQIHPKVIPKTSQSHPKFIPKTSQSHPKVIKSHYKVIPKSSQCHSKVMAK